MDDQCLVFTAAAVAVVVVVVVVLASSVVVNTLTFGQHPSYSLLQY